MSLSSGSSRLASAPEDKEFVPPTKKANRPFNRLIFVGYVCGLSFHSVNLKFTGEVAGERSIYDTIRINTGTLKVCTIYDQSSAMADSIPSPSGADLSICGPRYFVEAHAPTALYVDLSEIGSGGHKPFFHGRVPLKPFRISPNETKSVLVTLGEVATLIITVTGISPCTSTFIQALLLYPNSYSEWLVSESVTAIQHIDGGQTAKRLTLFERSEECPVRAAAAEGVNPTRYPDRTLAVIELDRDAVLAPLLFEDWYIRKLNEVIWSGLDPTDGPANDNGCYLTLEVDLELVEEASGKYCSVQGSLHYQFKGSLADGAVFIASLKGGAGRDPGKGKEPKLPRLSKSIPLSPHDDDEIQVKLVVVPITDLSCTMGKEPYEFTLPFYKREQVPDDDSDSDSDTDSE